MSTLKTTNIAHPSSASNNIVLDSSGRALVGLSSANANGGILQLSSGITFPATQVLSTDANTLDDYEEGDFTPTIFGASTAGTSTYTYQLGKYVKIGRQVSITCLVGVSAATGTGEMRIGGLPFTVGTDVYAATAPQVSSLNWGGGTYITLYASPGQSALQPFYNSDDGAQTNQQMVNEAQTFTFFMVYFV